MAYGNSRAGEQLTRKDTVFAAISSLALLDKRAIARKLNIETVADLERAVTQVAAHFSDYIQNGRVNGSADQALIQCASCLSDYPEDEMYDVQSNGNPEVFCRRCFEGLVEESREVVQDVPV